MVLFELSKKKEKKHAEYMIYNYKGCCHTQVFVVVSLLACLARVSVRTVNHYSWWKKQLVLCLLHL